MYWVLFFFCDFRNVFLTSLFERRPAGQGPGQIREAIRGSKGETDLCGGAGE